MHLYETTFILSPQADDVAFDRQIKAITELIQRHNGKIVRENRWGIRRLAYPIKKFSQGYYTRFIFTGDSDLLGELDRFYRLEEPYIRQLTVRYEGDLEESEREIVAAEEKKSTPEKSHSEEKPAEPVEPPPPEEPKPEPPEPAASETDTPEADEKATGDQPPSES